MSKQRPDPDKMVNDLAGASAFFPQSARSPVVEPPTVEVPKETPPSPPSPLADPLVMPLPANDAMTSRRHDRTTSSPTSDQPAGFEISCETASRDSLRLSIEEMKALEAMRSTLKWEHELTVSKNDICRVALHWLIEDFQNTGEHSQAVARLRKKIARR